MRTWKRPLTTTAALALILASGCPIKIAGDDDTTGDDDDTTGDDDDITDDDTTSGEACVDTTNGAALDDTVCALDAACVLSGGAGSAFLGYSLAGGGDFDGDGLEDLAAGAPGWTVVDVEGRALLYTAGSFDEPSVAPTAYLDGQEPLEKVGFAVGFAPDMDGDGLDELLAGARGDMDHGPGSGALYVVHGHALSGSPATPELLTADAAIRGLVEWGRVGASLSGVRDATGDGLGELALAFELFSKIEGIEVADDGRIALFHGRAGGLSGELTTDDADLVLGGGGHRRPPGVLPGWPWGRDWRRARRSAGRRSERGRGPRCDPRPGRSGPAEYR